MLISTLIVSIFALTPAETLSKECYRKCTRALTSQDCNKAVKNQNGIEACARDCLILGGRIDVTSSHAENYKLACLQYTDELQSSTVSSDRVKSTGIKQRMGFGNFNCPNDCNSKGKCTRLGCKCISGFSGDSCEIKTE